MGPPSVTVNVSQRRADETVPPVLEPNQGEAEGRRPVGLRSQGLAEQAGERQPPFSESAA